MSVGVPACSYDTKDIVMMREALYMISTNEGLKGLQNHDVELVI